MKAFTKYLNFKEKELKYLTINASWGYVPALRYKTRLGFKEMKVVNSLKTLKKRDRNCRVIRRKGRVYVINKTNPRFKARQG